MFLVVGSSLSNRYSPLPFGSMGRESPMGRPGKNTVQLKCMTLRQSGKSFEELGEG